MWVLFFRERKMVDPCWTWKYIISRFTCSDAIDQIMYPGKPVCAHVHWLTYMLTNQPPQQSTNDPLTLWFVSDPWSYWLFPLWRERWNTGVVVHRFGPGKGGLSWIGSSWKAAISPTWQRAPRGGGGVAAAVAAVASRGSKVAVETWLAHQNKGCRTNTEPISILWLILWGLAGFCLIGALSVKKISLCSTGWGWISPGGKADIGGSFVESEHPRIQSWRGLKCGWILVSFHWTRRGFSGNHILEFSSHFP